MRKNEVAPGFNVSVHVDHELPDIRSVSWVLHDASPKNCDVARENHIDNWELISNRVHVQLIVGRVSDDLKVCVH